MPELHSESSRGREEGNRDVLPPAILPPHALFSSSSPPPHHPPPSSFHSLLPFLITTSLLFHLTALWTMKKISENQLVTLHSLSWFTETVLASLTFYTGFNSLSVFPGLEHTTLQFHSFITFPPKAFHWKHLQGINVLVIIPPLAKSTNSPTLT